MIYVKCFEKRKNFFWRSKKYMGAQTKKKLLNLLNLSIVNTKYFLV